MVFSTHFRFHIHAQAHASTCMICLTSSAWVIHEKCSGDVRHRLPSARTVKPANSCGEEGISFARTPELPQPKWLSLNQADFPNSRWLKEPLIQRLHRHRVPNVSARLRGKLGCVNGSPSPQLLALAQGSHHPHPRLPHAGHGTAAQQGLLRLRAASRSERVTDRICSTQPRAGAGFQKPTEEPFTSLVFPCCKHQLHGSDSWPGWISVDLSNFLQKSLLTKGLCEAM